MSKKTTAQVKRPASTIAPTGWFSRRHETSEAHTRAVERYLWHRGPVARKRRVQNRKDWANE